MESSALQKVIAFAAQHDLFPKDGRVLASVSGGSDSTALFLILVTLQQRGLINGLVCVHFNHQLRHEAGQDARFVEALARHHGTRFVCETQDIRTRAQENHSSVETAGRGWRLERLLDLAREHQCSIVATGHHLDDNAETMIHRLSRGTGYRGLCGIRPARTHQGVRIISPLLALTRQAIRAFLTDQEQPWREDATNQEQIHTRNRIRGTLLPELSRQCPVLSARLSELALKCHGLYLHQIEPRARALRRLHVRISPDSATVALDALSQESDLVRVECLRQIMTSLDIPLRTVTQRHYSDLLSLVQREAARVNLPDRTCAVLDKGEIRFLRPSVVDKPEPAPVELRVPGVTRFDPLRFHARIIKPPQMDPQHRSNRSVEYVDLARVTLPLRVRRRRTGDRFVPLGRTSDQKVGKFLSRANLSRGDRDRSVIVYDHRGTILWVCPVRMSEQVKVTDQTKKVLEITVENSELSI